MTADEITAAIREHGSIRAAAPHLGIDERTVRRRLEKAGVKPGDPQPSKPGWENSSIRVDGDTATIIEPPTERPKLGDIGKLIRERGLDPDEWIVVSTTLNEWDGMMRALPGQENRLTRLKQWKVTLKRRPELVLAAPAVHVPPVKRVPRPATRDVPELIVVEGDHQAPYHDPKLHEASLEALRYWHDECNMTEHVFLGDTGDYPTISKHADHPAASAPVNDVIQSVYELLRDKREAAPDARARKLKGNHDWRVESELLARAERMYGIKPANTGDADELPALSLRRLLHLDALGIELVEDPRGWEHGEVELVDGLGGLVIRHGWLTGANSAARSVAKRGRSMITGHTHTPEHHFVWDPSAGLIRQAVTAPAMCRVRSQTFPHFAVLDRWLQGVVTVLRWPGTGEFSIETAIWDGERLRWRDKEWTA